MKVKKIGLYICILGSLAAALYPPYSIVDITGWAFLFSDIVGAFGVGVPVYDHLNYIWLGGELLVINVIGLVLMRLR